MKILIVNRALGTLFGGGESFDYNAARQLSSRGHDVTMVTGRPVCGEPRNRYADVQVVYLPSPGLRRFAYATEHVHSKLSAAFYHLDNLLFEQSVLWWFSKQPRNAFDIVQCCSLFDLPKWLLNRHAQPVVTWLPGPPSGRVRARLPALLRQQHFGLFTHGAPEQTLREMKLSPDIDFQIIEPGVELATVDTISGDRKARRDELCVPDAALLGVTTARLVPVKNHVLLIDALARARRRGVIWHWLFIGEGPLEAQLRQLAHAAGVADQIHFLGHKPQHVVHGWLAVSDLFALTSRYENFSIATLEAMAHRLPVIGTAVGYLQRLVADSGAGRIVDASDARDLTSALIDMADHRLRQAYGEAGRRFVEHRDWPRVAERLDSFLGRVIAGRLA